MRYSTPIALPYAVTSGWLVQRSATHRHQGLDLVPIGRPALGEPVLAVADGIVTHAVRGGSSRAYYARGAEGYGFSGYGRAVAVQHDIEPPLAHPLYSLYAHLDQVDVEQGERVSAGQRLGTVGRTGYTSDDPRRLITGPHLHWELAERAYPLPRERWRIDPALYLYERAVDLPEVHPAMARTREHIASQRGDATAIALLGVAGLVMLARVRR